MKERTAEKTTATVASGDAAEGRNPFRDLLKGTSLYTIIMVAQRAMSILLLPIYTRYLSRADYGVLELLDLMVSVAGMLMMLRLGQALFYYYFHAADEAERDRYVTTALFSSALIAGGVGVTGILLAEPISLLVFSTAQYEDLVRIAFLGFAMEPPLNVGLSYLRVRNKMGTFVSISLARLVANVVLNVVFLTLLGLGAASLLWSRVITAGVAALLLSRSILTTLPPLFRIAAIRNMALYGLPLGIGAVGDFLLHFGDRMFLSKTVSLTDLGIYALAYKLGMVVPFVTGPFFTYWNAQMIGIVRRPQGEYTYARVATYLLLILAVVALLLTVFTKPMLSVLAASEFHGAAALIPWIALAYSVRGMGSYWSNTFLLERRPALVARTTWMGGGACLLAYALLIPPYGLWGAVAATVLGFSAMAAYAFWKSQRVRHFQYEYGRWAKIVACAASATLPSVLLQPEDFWAQIALGSACVCLFAMLLWSVRFATSGERHAALASLRRLFGRRRFSRS